MNSFVDFIVKNNFTTEYLDLIAHRADWTDKCNVIAKSFEAAR